jgi:hypothetical protein
MLLRMRTIALVVALLFIGGCTEEPQELVAAGNPGFQTDSWNDQLRERTLRQGEPRRIYH